MISLRPPKTAYKSIDDIGKFDMIWNVSLALVPIFIILLTIHIIFQDDSWLTSSVALAVSFGNLVALYKLRKYEIVALSSVIIGVLVVQTVIFIVNDSHLISDTMWCILVSLFTYFLFGTIYGSIVLVINLTGLLVFLMNGSQSDIVGKGGALEQVDYKMLINVYYVAFALAFIIYKMLKNNEMINKRYEKENQHNEILIKEIHHRVKNNLQIISSLLRLQAAESTNEKVVEHFGEAINRIRAMALIHEKMYHDDDLSNIDIPAYLVDLANDIVNSIQTDCNIEFKAESDVKDIDIEHIVPISLIFNELITNSLKHGFANKSSGSIRIDINHVDGKLVFHYQDNGEWQVPKVENTFGLELLETLTEQLDGEYRREINKGTHYYFEFEANLFLPE